MKIIIIPLEIDGYLFNSGSQMFRCDWLAPYLPADIYNRSQNLDDYDVIIYQKVGLSLEVRQLAERYKNKLQIFDLTDAEHLFRPEIVKYMIDRCEIITASNKELADSLAKFSNQPVYVIPDRIDFKGIRVRKIHEDKMPVIVWFGYGDNFQYARDLIRECRRYRYIIISDYDVGVGGYIRWEKETYQENIIKGDIVINPKGIFKSDNKTFLSWALGMPVARTFEEVQKLSDYRERIKESELRFKEVIEKGDIKISAQELVSLITARSFQLSHTAEVKGGA